MSASDVVLLAQSLPPSLPTPVFFDKLRNLDYSCYILNQIRWSIKLLKLSHFALASITSFSRPQAPFFERERERENMELLSVFTRNAHGCCLMKMGLTEHSKKRKSEVGILGTYFVNSTSKLSKSVARS